jgi:2-iminobutanoate/2-iminopropanoate deaminase
MKISVIALLVSVVMLSACQPSSDSRAEVEHLYMPGVRELGRPFSSAVRVDNILYLSGMIGVDPATGRPAAGGIQAETRLAMDAIKKTVEHFGSSMDRIAKCTAFIADMSEWSAMNEIYVTYFDTPPARSALGVNGLALNARMEIECIAVL